MKEIFSNYETFYNMVLSTTIMSNAKTEEYDREMSKIIEFIGKAYRLSDSFIDECIDVILNKLSSLALTTDQQAVYSARQYGECYSDENVLFDIKGDVLIKLQSIVQESRNADINNGWYDYSHYKTYQSNVRAAKIEITSGGGNIIATRQMGILYALGIGVEKNLRIAAKRLTQCVYWGDIPSAYYLGYVYSLLDNKEESAVYYEVAELLTRFLVEGITVLDGNEFDRYSDRALELYAYISSIKQDIVYAYKHFDIDLSFVEAITLPALTKEKRMYFINNYDKKEWKDLTHSSYHRNKVGF